MPMPTATIKDVDEGPNWNEFGQIQDRICLLTLAHIARENGQPMRGECIVEVGKLSDWLRGACLSGRRVTVEADDVEASASLEVDELVNARITGIVDGADAPGGEQ